MNPELVKFHLPTTDQFSVAVDTLTTAFRLAGSQPGSTEHAQAELAIWLERAQTYAERVGRLMAVA